jgi:hypothetical protein
MLAQRKEWGNARGKKWKMEGVIGKIRPCGRKKYRV